MRWVMRRVVGVLVAVSHEVNARLNHAHAASCGVPERGVLSPRIELKVASRAEGRGPRVGDGRGLVGKKELRA